MTHPAENDAPFRADLGRQHLHDATGIYVRAKVGERWGNADIAELDADSLHRFLRSRGGDNPWAESVVLILLGHDHTVFPPSDGATDAIERLAQAIADYYDVGEVDRSSRDMATFLAARVFPPGPCPDTGVPVESCLCMTHDPDGAHFRATRVFPPEEKGQTDA